MNTFNDAADLWVAADPARPWVIFAVWMLAVAVAFGTFVKPWPRASRTGKTLAFVSRLFCLVVLASFALTFSRAAVSLWLPDLAMWIDWMPSLQWGQVPIIMILSAVALVLRLVHAPSTPMRNQ